MTMRNTLNGARVYRFHDSVAINLQVEGRYTETFYIPEALAHLIGTLVGDTAEDITLNKFTASDLGTWLATTNDDGVTRMEKE